ncbi:MAG TPA: CPBP family intramembrane glutamic endopeptidase [Candidatus Acidoferrales bacterium]|nr:CPBP family intramembrane glutamic endopeptidase [Candidatus Acidoferrales bacterium]
MLRRLMYWDYMIILVLLGVFVPWRSNARVRLLLDGPPLSSFERIQLYLSTMSLQWMIVAIILWRAEAHHLSLASLGIALPNPQRAVAVAAVLSIVLVLNQVFGLRRIASLPAAQRGIIPSLAERLLPRTAGESCVAILLVISVAICEELIYRGFVQTFFQDAFHGYVSAGAVLSALFFSVAHLYQGRKGILTTFVVGLIFSATRIWTGSLFPSILIHFCVDLSAGILASRLPPLLGSVFYLRREGLRSMVPFEVSFS